MKQYCYVVLYWNWEQASLGTQLLAGTDKVGLTLDEILKDGWHPVRETPMGVGGKSQEAYALLLLEKQVERPRRRARASKVEELSLVEQPSC